MIIPTIRRHQRIVVPHAVGNYARGKKKLMSNLCVAAMLMIISIQLTRRDTIRERIASHWQTPGNLKHNPGYSQKLNQRQNRFGLIVRHELLVF